MMSGWLILVNCELYVNIYWRFTEVRGCRAGFKVNNILIPLQLVSPVPIDVCEVGANREYRTVAGACSPGTVEHPVRSMDHRVYASDLAHCSRAGGRRGEG
jgi:hypothetical protein